MDLQRPLLVRNGDFALVSGSPEIAQRIAARLLTYRGEWFLDANVGTPYHEQILGSVPDPQAAASVFRAVVQADPDVLAVPTCDVSFSGASRGLSVYMEITIRATATATPDTVTIELVGLPDGALVVDGISVTVGGVPVILTL